MSDGNFLYFAYGSNMLPQRLQARCVSPRFISLARVADHDIVFSKPSGDGSAKATLVKKGGASTPGVLFAIARSDLPALDHAEGAGSGYKRIDSFTLEDRTGAPVTATTYIASAKDFSLKPYDWYLALVIAGARHHALCEEHIRKLRLTEYRKDKDQKRQGRREALNAFRAHGIPDYNVLLESVC